MAIYKRHLTREYVQIHNSLAADQELSYKAKGILVYLLSRPPTWEANVNDIANHSTDGRYAVRSGLSELEEQGFITRSWIRDDDGQFGGFQFDVYDRRQPEHKRTSPEDRRHSDSEGAGSQDPGIRKPETGEPDTSNTECSNTEYSNTKDLSSSKNEDDIPQSSGESTNASEQSEPPAVQGSFTSEIPDNGTLHARTEADDLLFDRLTEKQHAMGRRAPARKFDTPHQKQKWRRATKGARDMYGEGALEQIDDWITQAFETANMPKARLIQYVDACVRGEAEKHRRDAPSVW